MFCSLSDTCSLLAVGKSQVMFVTVSTTVPPRQHGTQWCVVQIHIVIESHDAKIPFLISMFALSSTELRRNKSVNKAIWFSLFTQKICSFEWIIHQWHNSWGKKITTTSKVVPYMLDVHMWLNHIREEKQEKEWSCAGRGGILSCQFDKAHGVENMLTGTGR